MHVLRAAAADNEGHDVFTKVAWGMNADGVL